MTGAWRPAGWRPVPGGFEYGWGPTLVLIPGLRGDPSEYVALAPRIPGRTLRLVTLPDAGRRLTDIAAAVVADLPRGEWDVLGASFGGLVGWAMPADRVRTLTTIGTLPHRTPRAARMRAYASVVRRLPERVYQEVYGPRARASLAEDGADDTLLEHVALPPARVLADRLSAIAAWGLPDRPPGTRHT